MFHNPSAMSGQWNRVLCLKGLWNIWIILLLMQVKKLNKSETKKKEGAKRFASFS